MKTLKWLDKNFEGFCMIIFLVLISCIMMAQIVMRYVFHASMSWPEEACRYMWIASTCFSLGYVIKNNNALKVDVVMSLLPPKLMLLLTKLIDMLLLFLHGYMTFYSFKTMRMIIAARQLSPAMRMPMWILYLFLTIGFALGTFRYGQLVYIEFKEGKPI